MKRLLTILIAMCCAFVSGCGSAPVVAGAPSVIGAWIPKIFGYLGSAESALNLIGVWVNRWSDVPQVAQHLPELNQLLQDARQSFNEARELARKGAEFEEQARELYAQGRETLDKAVALVESLGMHRDGKLVRPPEAAERSGCTRADAGPDEIVLDLPPNQV